MAAESCVVLGHLVKPLILQDFYGGVCRFPPLSFGAFNKLW